MPPCLCVCMCVCVCVCVRACVVCVSVCVCEREKEASLDSIHFVRREQLYEVLKGTDVFPLSITVFPRLGCPGFTQPEYIPNTAESASRSLFYPDEAIWSGHPRFV